TSSMYRAVTELQSSWLSPEAHRGTSSVLPCSSSSRGIRASTRPGAIHTTTTAGTRHSGTSRPSTTLGNAPINWKPTTRTATGPNEGGGPVGGLHSFEPLRLLLLVDDEVDLRLTGRHSREHLVPDAEGLLGLGDHRAFQRIEFGVAALDERDRDDVVPATAMGRYPTGQIDCLANVLLPALELERVDACQLPIDSEVDAGGDIVGDLPTPLGLGVPHVDHLGYLSDCALTTDIALAKGWRSCAANGRWGHFAGQAG